MRHHRANRKFHRVKRQREALLKSLARSLVLKEGITTTVAKAKELRPFVEKLVTASKKDTLASRREITAQLGSATKKLYELRSRFEKRSGGYVRIVRLGRVGKRAIESARIEFVQ
jgi:large subunit ribosomal protein L17